MLYILQFRRDARWVDIPVDMSAAGSCHCKNRLLCFESHRDKGMQGLLGVVQ